jgi:hypothetical protein
VPSQEKVHDLPKSTDYKLFDFRPVFRNRSAMAYAIAYCVHTLKMNALRGWTVAYLAYVTVSTGTKSASFSPSAVAIGLALVGTAASVFGNEAAIRLGRRKLIHSAMMAPIAVAIAIGIFGTT